MTSDSDYDSSSQKSSIWIYWVAGFCFTPVNGLIAYNQIIGRGPLCMGYSKTNPLGKTPLTLFGESRWTQCIVDMFCALVASRNGLGSLKIRLLGLDPIRFKGSAIGTKPMNFCLMSVSCLFLWHNMRSSKIKGINNLRHWGVPSGRSDPSLCWLRTCDPWPCDPLMFVLGSSMTQIYTNLKTSLLGTFQQVSDE